MIGGGADVYSKTVVGVDATSGALLILDPHYVGSAVHDADVEGLRAGGWATWHPLSSALSAASFYNVALPRPLSEAARALAANASAPPAPDANLDWSGMFEVVESGSES